LQEGRLMCGIAGVAGGNLDQERDAVKRMTLALAHRGPDDSGHYEDEDVVLGISATSVLLSRSSSPWRL
jgi:asparagine synthase (glutamine-hydrolysing)